MGIFPACSVAIRARSLSVAITSCPASARQLPDTSPTYPQPITANFTLVLPWEALPSGATSANNDSRRFPALKEAAFCQVFVGLLTCWGLAFSGAVPVGAARAGRARKMREAPKLYPRFLGRMDPPERSPRSASRRRRGWLRAIFHRTRE